MAAQRFFPKALISSFFGACVMFLTHSVFAQTVSMSSPNDKLQARWQSEPQPAIKISTPGGNHIATWQIGFIIAEREQPILPNTEGTIENGEVRTTHATRLGIKSTVPDHYNWWKIPFSGGFSVEVRLYDEAVAYRWHSERKGQMHVLHEKADLSLNADDKLLYAVTNTLQQNYEHTFSLDKPGHISGWMTLPATVRSQSGKTLLVTETGLLDYPSLFLDGKRGLASFTSYFPKRVLEDSIGGFNNFDRIPTKRAEDMAFTKGERPFPWRLVVAVDEEKELLEQMFVWKLAEPNRIKNPGWVKPGLVSWDWWNNWSIYNVPFESGVNTETYKYMIDIAAEHGIPYVNLDEGWSDTQDLTKIKEEVDVAELAQYAEKKNVGLFLWCVWHTLDRQMDEALYQFEKWGIAGIKVDFMNRDDQQMVQYYERLARKAAEHKLLVNLHGAYKPAGLHRTWPNVINREAVLGNEYNKWSADVTPKHQVTLPFTRMAAGPMDFTPGGMRNAGVNKFFIYSERPWVQGTRAHQMAMFVVYFGPLQMLADSPTDYLKEPEVFKFLTSIPTVWDETVAISGKAQSHVVMARRQGETWYLAAMTNENPREFKFALDFLDKDTSYKMTAWKDGANAEKVPRDAATISEVVSGGNEITLKLKPAGGWIGRFIPQK